MAKKSATAPEPRTETLRLGSTADGVTIKNNIERDVMILCHNLFHGCVSVGYVQAGQSITMPTIVNVDAFALDVSGANVFLRWPGPTVTCNRKKENLTPGQSYSLSDFGPSS